MIVDNRILPARVLKYYPETQTADIKVCAERVFSNTDGVHQVTDREVLQGVPVYTASGGGWSVTFPIKPNDTCLVVFSQIGYDHWLYNDKDLGGTLVGQPVPHLQRSFSEDDGFALVGFNTLPKAIQGYNPEDSQWRDATAEQVISLNSDKTITINTPVSLTVTAPQITLLGNVSIVGEVDVTGGITSTGDIVASGISSVSHIHTGDSGGTTSAPN